MLALIREFITAGSSTINRIGRKLFSPLFSPKPSLNSKLKALNSAHSRGFIETLPIIILSIIALTTLVITNSVKNQQEIRDRAQGVYPCGPGRGECSNGGSCVEVSPGSGIFGCTTPPNTSTPIPPKRYSCGAGGSCVQDANGEFLSLGECSSMCRAPSATPRPGLPEGSSCSSGNDCLSRYCVKLANDSGPTCHSAPGCPSSCTNGCSSVDGNGDGSLDCNSYCSAAKNSECPGACVPTSTGGICQAATGVPIKFSCSSNFQCIQDTNGTYTTAAGCQAVCKPPPTAVPTAAPNCTQGQYSCIGNVSKYCFNAYSATADSTCSSGQTCVGD